MIIDTWTCGKCAKIGQRRKGTDRYCVECRRAYNAKRSTPDAKKARADSYYWNVHVPQMRARLETKYPMSRGKLGVFHQNRDAYSDYGDLKGLTYTRQTWEGYQAKLDHEQD